MYTLKKISRPLLNRNFVINIILDGVANSPRKIGDAFKTAHKPVLDSIKKKFLYRELYAHGTYVGLPSNNEMGNSEVGHNAIGSGKIYPQGAKLVNLSLQDGSLFHGKTWKEMIDFSLKNNATIHFLGLLSDGYVHSHIDHLKRLSEKACESGIKTIKLHAILDGRDVHPDSSIKYIDDIESFFKKIQQQYQIQAQIVSVGGRMLVFMDRYDADWGMVEKGWRLMVEGNCERTFPSAKEGIETIKREKYTNDQYVEPFLIKNPHSLPTQVEDGDAVVLFNYRGDRALEISQTFDRESVPHFKKNKNPHVFFAGMMQYDGDLFIPKNFLVNPPHITNTMGEYLVKEKHKIFAISETQKYGHVTYFWNGNRSSKFDDDLEDYYEIKSDNVPFDQRPWMKVAEITDLAIEKIISDNYSFGRINYPNGDMVGHTGDFNAARIAIEAVDMCLGRLLDVVKQYRGIAIITADHGNCDEMYQINNKEEILKDSNGESVPKTSHTLNPVPIIIYDPQYGSDEILYTWTDNPDAGIANIAATTFHLMGYHPPEDYQPSLIKWD